MSKQTGPVVRIAAFPIGVGLFSIFYPLFIKLFALVRLWADYQTCLLVGGLILLISSFGLFRMGKSGSDHR